MMQENDESAVIDVTNALNMEKSDVQIFIDRATAYFQLGDSNACQQAKSLKQSRLFYQKVL